MNVVSITSLAEFEKLESSWNECVEKSVDHSLFLRHEWFANFLRHIDDYRALCILAVRDGDHPAGFFPGRLAATKIHRLNLRTIAFLSNYYSPICTVIRNAELDDRSPTVERAVLAHLARQVKGWDVMLLQDIPEEAEGYSRLGRALEHLAIPHRRYKTSTSWYLPCADTTYESYLESRSAKRRKKWLYERRRLENQENVSFHIQQAADERLEPAIDAYYEVYSRSWKKPEPAPDFHRDLIRIAAGHGWLRLGVVRIGERAIASQLWLVHEGKASIVKVAYDPDYRKFSPGTVLMLAMMQHVLDVDHVREVDFLSGDDSYKQEWMSHHRLRHTMLVYNTRSLRGRLLLLLDRYVWPSLGRS